MCNRNFKIVISFFLISAMILSSAVICFAEEDTTLNYVSFGNSCCTGFGLSDYMRTQYNDDRIHYMGYRFECNDSLPYLFYNYLKTNLSSVSESFGRNFTDVSIDQIGFTNVREKDYNTIIEYGTDGFDPDNESLCYINSQYTSFGFFECYTKISENVLGLVNPTTDAALRAISEDIKKSIRNADIISIDCATSGFGSAVFKRALNGTEIDIDAKLREVGIPFSYDEAYSLVFAAVKAAGIVSSDDYEMLNKISKYGTYAYIDYCIEYDRFIKNILDLNPNVRILVMEASFDNGYFLTSTGSKTVNLADFGSIATSLITSYVCGLSPYNDRIIFVPTQGTHISTFLDDASRDISEYSDDLISCIEFVLKYKIGFTYDELDDIVANKKDVLNRILGICKPFLTEDYGVATIDESISKEDIREFLLGNYSGPYSDDELINSFYGYGKIHFDSFKMHPNKEGYITKFELLRDAFENPKTPQEVLDARGVDACKTVAGTVFDSAANFSSDLGKLIFDFNYDFKESFLMNIKGFAENTYNLLINNINECFDNILSAIGL